MPQTRFTLILAAIILTLAVCLIWIATRPMSPAIERMEQTIPDSNIPH